MKKNIAKLIELITANPDLPVIAMIDQELMHCDFGRMLAKFGYVRRGEYVLYQDEYIYDRDVFKKRYYYYNDDVLRENFGYDPRINKLRLRRANIHSLSLKRIT